MNDTTTILIALALLVIAIGIFASVALSRHARRRSAELRQRFGPEYERAVEQYGSKADRVLATRERRVNKIQIRDLSEAERARFTSAFTGIQALFVDDPRAAVVQANELIKEVMRARGYSANDGFDQRVADLSVDHPDVVQHYRAARALAVPGRDADLSTEDLRQAVVHYRVIFSDLVQPTRAAIATLRPSHA
jgi:type II secretory pathway pseudopilin PulG